MARSPAVVVPLDLRRAVQPERRQRMLVIGDCENDTESVTASLRFAGVLSKRGEFKSKARGVRLVQTGDMLHKNAPRLAVAQFWQALRTTAEAAGCTLQLVAGNHEMEIWQRLRSSRRLGLTRNQQRSILEFIRGMQLFHLDGSVFLIHGYPTVKLLRHMRAYQTRSGKPLNNYNQDEFQPTFDDARRLARYAYARRNACRGSLLHDVTDPERYYRRHGREVAELLDSFGVDLVVHGHRPERSGMQIDQELERWLPGIRMINNDIQLRLQGLGATAIQQREHGTTDLLFINQQNSGAKHRKRVRKLLREPERPAGEMSNLRKTIVLRGAGCTRPNSGQAHTAGGTAITLQ